MVRQTAAINALPNGDAPTENRVTVGRVTRPKTRFEQSLGRHLAVIEAYRTTVTHRGKGNWPQEISTSISIHFDRSKPRRDAPGS